MKSVSSFSSIDLSGEGGGDLLFYWLLEITELQKIFRSTGYQEFFKLAKYHEVKF